MRGSYAQSEGDDEAQDQPLNSIEPDKGVLGFAYRAPSQRYGGEFIGTFVGAKDAEDVSGDDLFLPDSYTLLDVNFYYNFNDAFRLNAAAFNLMDETVWLWSNVRGRSAGDPIIDRFSSPGRTLSLNLNYQW